MFQRPRRPFLAVALGAALATAACDTGGDNDGFTGQEWTRLRDMSTNPAINPVLPNPVNKHADDPKVVKLGQMLMFETDLSEALTADNANGKKGEIGKVGCVSCHDPRYYFVRPEATSAGLGAPGKRNAPNMLNLAYLSWFGWTGRHDSMVMHGSGVMGASGTRLFVAHYLYRKYKDEWNDAFPELPLDPALDAMDASGRFPPTGNPKSNEAAADGPWEKMSAADQHYLDQVAWKIGCIWDAYPRALVTRNSAFQEYLDGNRGAISGEAKRGLKLFIGKAACNDCHEGPALSDSKAHNVGVTGPPPPPAPAMAPAADMGRYADLASTLNHKFNGASEFSDDRTFGSRKLLDLPALDDTSMQGAFRTPVLLNIEKTGPYFHNGLVTTLEEVVRHYNNGGGASGTFAGAKDPRLKRLLLTDSEMADIVSFLKSLTGELSPDLTTDIAKH